MLWSKFLIVSLAVANCVLLACLIGVRMRLETTEANVLTLREELQTRDRLAQERFSSGDQPAQAVVPESSSVEVPPPESREPASASIMNLQLDLDAQASVMERLTTRPGLADTPILGAAEFQALLERRGNLPRDLRQDVLLQGDVDSLLGSVDWNPSGRDFDVAGRAELGILLKDYVYFARLARQERIQARILPEVEHMRSLGRYVEYPSTEPPPKMDGATLTHAEGTENPDVFRLYGFPESEYSDLYHEQTVEYQRELETFVRVYEFINRS